MITLWEGRDVLVFLLFFVKCGHVLENGLARTPPMGWMSWGFYMCADDCEKDPKKCLNEDLILQVADRFYTQGYQEAGYEYIIIDDCWSERQRDSSGDLVADRTRFPNGMKYIADYIHSRGLKFGMYTNIAKVTCMYYPGSLGHFENDAKTFAKWGVDYLKVDGCYVPKMKLNIAYIELGDALKKAGRPVVYSCSWPYYIEFIHHNKPNYTTISKHCNLWRNYHDVVKSWPSVRDIILHYEMEYHNMVDYHGPGHWNDPDMLILGTNSLSDGQSRVQMSVYSMLSAPLLLSCDVTMITEFERSLLQNLDLIAIAQDSAGIMARPYKIDKFVTLWVKMHYPKKGNIYPSFSFALVNLYDENASVSFTPGEYGLNHTDGYTVLDIFSSKYIRNITLNDTIEVDVLFQDVIMYTLYPL